MARIIGFLVAVALLMMTSCEEENPGVKFTEPEKPLLDTTYTISNVPAAQDKRVLLFDITGVRCNNCPDAAAIARKIADTLYPGKVTVVALYPTSVSPILTKPWPGYDTMTSDDAETITSYLGTVPNLPIGCVDQLKVSNSYFIDRNSWSSHVGTQLSKTTPLNIDLNSTWDGANNRSRLEIKVTYTQNVSATHLIMIGVIESGIIGKQSDLTAQPDGYRDDYEFNHVFRKSYTTTSGDTLNSALAPGRVFEKHYYIKPRYNWNADHLDAVVWVLDADTREVIHVQHKALK